MDILCSRCGEPWELETLHDVIDEQHAEELEALRLQHYGVRTIDEVYGPEGVTGVWTPSAGRAFQADYERTLWKPMLARFQAEGCAATGWCDPCEPVHNNRTAVAAMLYDLLGDDVDGAAAMLDDAEWMGVLD